MLATAEHVIGWYGAAALAVTSNVVLFTLVGLLVRYVATTSIGRLVTGAVVVGALVLWGLWGAGFDPGGLHGLALLCAAVVWTAPIALAHSTTRSGRTGA